MNTIRRPDNGIHVPKPRPDPIRPSPVINSPPKRSFLQNVYEEFGYASTLEVAKEKVTRKMWVTAILGFFPLAIVLATWKNPPAIFGIFVFWLLWCWLVCPVNYYSKYQQEKKRILGK